MLLRNGELYSGNKVRTCAASQGFENFQFANNQIFVERNIIEFCQFTITAKHLWILGHLKFHLLECMQRITKRRFDIRLPRKATRTQRLPRDPNQTNFSRVTESDNRYKKKITQPHTSDRFSESDHTPPEWPKPNNLNKTSPEEPKSNHLNKHVPRNQNQTIPSKLLPRKQNQTICTSPEWKTKPS